jgi:hypothetical protein
MVTTIAVLPALRPAELVDRWMISELRLLSCRQLAALAAPLVDAALEGRLDPRSKGALMLVLAALAERVHLQRRDLSATSISLGGSAW